MQERSLQLRSAQAFALERIGQIVDLDVGAAHDHTGGVKTNLRSTRELLRYQPLGCSLSDPRRLRWPDRFQRMPELGAASCPDFAEDNQSVPPGDEIDFQPAHLHVLPQKQKAALPKERGHCCFALAGEVRAMRTHMPIMSAAATSERTQ